MSAGIRASTPDPPLQATIRHTLHGLGLRAGATGQVVEIVEWEERGERCRVYTRWIGQPSASGGRWPRKSCGPCQRWTS